MKVLVVYESMFGNTEQVARAIAAGVRESMDVELTEVAAAPPDVGPVALIVAGGPTHAFSMSR
jgi:flavodoxin